MTKQLSKIAAAAIVALACFGIRAQEPSRSVEERMRKLAAEKQQHKQELEKKMRSDLERLKPLMQYSLEDLRPLRSAQVRGKAQRYALSHARLPVTLDDFLYPLCGIRHPCCRICQLYESFHPVPYLPAAIIAAFTRKPRNTNVSISKLNLLNVSLHSNVSSEWNLPKNPQNGWFFHL